MQYELVVEWVAGGKSTYAFFTESEAYRNLKNMQIAIGKKIKQATVRLAYTITNK